MNNTTPATNTMSPSWDLLKPSIALVREHYLGVIYLFLLPSHLAVLGSLMLGSPTVENDKLLLTDRQLQGLGLLGLSMIWQLVNIGPLTLFQWQAANGKADATTIGQYYRQGLRYTPRLVLYYFTFAVSLIVGLLLFIVPGLIVLRRYYLAGYYLVAKDLKVREALKQSADNSKPYAGAIWGVIGVQFALVILAALVQGVFSYIGIILAELIACSYLFIAVLRYKEIDPPATRKVSKAKKA